MHNLYDLFSGILSLFCAYLLNFLINFSLDSNATGRSSGYRR